MRALLVSDLHYDLRKLDWVLAEAADVDLLVVAGDLLDIASAVPLEAQIDVVLEYLARAARATTVVVCSGNHDLDHRTASGRRRRRGSTRRATTASSSTATPSSWTGGRSRRARGGRAPRRSPRWKPTSPPARPPDGDRGCGSGTARRRARCRGPAPRTTATRSCPACSSSTGPTSCCAGTSTRPRSSPVAPGRHGTATPGCSTAVTRSVPCRATSGWTSRPARRRGGRSTGAGELLLDQ